jgi:hypothetical protein
MGEYLWFRFPWPDEDEPGSFPSAYREVAIPDSFDVPCPHGETKRDHPRAYLVARGLRGNVLVPVLRCGGCRAMFRIEDPAQIEALAYAFRSQANDDQKYNRGTIYASHGYVIADRILAGANLTPKD